MAKKRVAGRKKVDEYVDVTFGVPITTYLIKKDMSFEVVVLDQSFRGKDGNALMVEALEYLEKTRSLTFVPVIHVEEVRPWARRREVAHVGFELERIYVAQRPSGVWRQVEWDVYQKNPQKAYQRTKHAQTAADNLPKVEHSYVRGGKFSVTLAYDENTWLGLEAIQEKIRELRTRFFDLLATDTGQERLAEIGSAITKALPEYASPEAV